MTQSQHVQPTWFRFVVTGCLVAMVASSVATVSLLWMNNIDVRENRQILIDRTLDRLTVGEANSALEVLKNRIDGLDARVKICEAKLE